MKFIAESFNPIHPGGAGGGGTLKSAERFTNLGGKLHKQNTQANTTLWF